MKTEVRKINKTTAEKMLKKNYSNRKLTRSNVLFLSKQMKEGKWLFDGQPIRFDEFGRLLDGQHRLNAVIDSDTTQEFLIVSGVPSEAFVVMDTGKNRSGGDALSILGISYANYISATARLVIKHKKGNHHKSGGGASKISNTDIVNWYNENKGIEEIAKRSHDLNKAFSKILSMSYIMYLIYVFSEKNVIEADIFIDELCYGTNLDRKSPSNVLRRVLISDKMSKSSMSANHKNAIIFKAWNAFRMKKSISILRYNKESEKFPILK